MFTPPPSPAPQKPKYHRSPSPSVSDDEGFLSPPSNELSSSSSLMLQSPSEEWEARRQGKLHTTRRIKWTILVVPVLLILITVSTRYLSHPPEFFDVLPVKQEASNVGTFAGSHRHKRNPSPHPAPVPQQNSGSSLLSGSQSSSPGSSASASASPTGPSSVSQTVPPIPASPPQLPTPFPQPLDQSLSTNFTTQGCENFFTNMTASTSFRSCRPFSLLLETSTAFIEAQDNLTALNNIVWGTCNTSIDESQCDSNMAWFTDSLKDQCAEDMKEQNAIVLQTLKGLEAYSLMRAVACLPNPTSGAYCYVEAVHNPSPTDLYFYSLPLGTQLPSIIQPSCSACTKSVMNLYAQSKNLTELSEVYNGAAQIANSACGTGFAQITAVNGAGRLSTGGERGALFAMSVFAFASVSILW